MTTRLQTAYYSVFLTLGLLTTVALTMSCNDSKPTSGSAKVVDSSAERVSKMSEGCPEVGDYQEDPAPLTGTYNVTQEVLPWFKLPRNENPIQQALKWDDAKAPLETPFKITPSKDKASIIVTILVQGKEQEFKGSLFQDQRLCFTGPITLDTGSVTSTASLFADGKFTLAKDKTPTKIDLHVLLGITADNAAAEKDKKALKRFEMLGTFKIIGQQKAATDAKDQQKTSGLFLQIGEGATANRTIYVNDELTVDSSEENGGPYLTATQRHQHFGAADNLPSKIKLPLPQAAEQQPVEVDVELTYAGESSTAPCTLQASAIGNDLKGSLICEGDDNHPTMSGQFFILGRPATDVQR